jgi:hypothetical protein
LWSNGREVAATKTDNCRVLILGDQGERRKQLRDVLAEAGYRVLEAAKVKRGGPGPTVILLLLDHDDPDQALIASLGKGLDYPPPVVVFGPARGKRWRREALQAGAFACLSDRAPREDQIGIVAAANRYRALQLEIEIIRRESDIVMQGLLESFGSEAVRLQHVMNEAEQVRESLEDVQTRIIRSLL